MSCLIKHRDGWVSKKKKNSGPGGPQPAQTPAVPHKNISPKGVRGQIPICLPFVFFQGFLFSQGQTTRSGEFDLGKPGRPACWGGRNSAESYYYRGTDNKNRGGPPKRRGFGFGLIFGGGGGTRNPRIEPISSGRGGGPRGPPRKNRQEKTQEKKGRKKI